MDEGIFIFLIWGINLILGKRGDEKIYKFILLYLDLLFTWKVFIEKVYYC